MRPGKPTWTLMLLAGLACACAPENGQSSCPATDPVFSLPADEAPHVSYMEWWYYTGHLWTQDERRFGFEVSFFQVAHQAVATYMAHFAISDAQNLQHHYDQRLGTAPGIFPRFDLSLEDWTMNGNGSVDRLSASMDTFGIELDLTSTKPPAIHNHRGLITMGGGMDSHYYSKTRMNVTGILTIDGTPETVNGMAWSDHQWGDFEIFASDGWDWFSIQLNDMTEIMIFMLHFKDDGPRLTGATFMDSEGCQHDIEEIQIESRSTWESPVTHALYPLGWDLNIPELDIVLSITPVFEAQEIDSRETTLNVYWEGETLVSGTRAGNPVEGLGYTELAGYGMWGP